MLLCANYFLINSTSNAEPHKKTIHVTVSSINNLTFERCKVLQGRNVVLYPDLDAFVKWQQKAKELSDIANFKVSELLELKASEAEKRQGLDLGEYLIGQPAIEI